MMRLAVRSRQDEQMDAETLDPATYEIVLSDLARVNRWTFTARPILKFVARAVGEADAFRLLDVGFGDGDVLRAIARWARKRRKRATLVGVDLNPKSAAIARAATPREDAITYVTGDYRDQRGPFDLIVSSQVTHHMTDERLDDFLRFMEEHARSGWLICDLHRHWFSYRGFPLLARLLAVHRIVREDGQLSIARSFRAGDWREILDRSGIDGADIRIARRFPFRLCVERVVAA